MLSLAFAGLGLLAALSAALSAMPPLLAACVGLLAAGQGLRLSRMEWRRPACVIVPGEAAESAEWQGAGQRAPMLQPRLALRGPLAALAWRDAGGTRRSLLWFADTLPVASRRRLRLRFGAGPLAAKRA